MGGRGKARQGRGGQRISKSQAWCGVRGHRQEREKERQGAPAYFGLEGAEVGSIIHAQASGPASSTAHRRGEGEGISLTK